MIANLLGFLALFIGIVYLIYFVILIGWIIAITIEVIQDRRKENRK